MNTPPTIEPTFEPAGDGKNFLVTLENHSCYEVPACYRKDGRLDYYAMEDNARKIDAI